MIIGFVADKEQKLDVAEEDIFKDIQKVWVEAIFTSVPGAISRVIVVEVEKAEESNQQFEYEWTMCSKWQARQ